MREPEPQTIAAAARGDRQAFVEIVHLYQLPVWRFLNRLLNDHSLAEDMAQETFVRVYRRLDTFAGRSRFSTWVFGIARHVGIDALRRQGRRPQVTGDLPPTLASPCEIGSRLELDRALASLPGAKREALLLVEVLGLSYREVSSLTGVPEGTIKSRVHGARASLHDWFTQGALADEV